MTTNTNRRVVVSIGSIPAKLNNDVIITSQANNDFASVVVRHLASCGHYVTIVAHETTELPADTDMLIEKVVRVKDVFEYYDWFKNNANNYEAFIMAANVANIVPVKSYGAMFPIKIYHAGDEFNLKFAVSPRAIDIIKQVNPTACLIGYKSASMPDDELTEIAYSTLSYAKANIIFASTPNNTDRKLAIMSNGVAIECDLNKHLELIDRAIRQIHYVTIVEPLTESEEQDVNVVEALTTVKMFKQSFKSTDDTVAIPVKASNMFATTSDKGEPVLVRSIDHLAKTIYATDEVVINAPALQAMLDSKDNQIAIYRQYNDEISYAQQIANYKIFTKEDYVFPGTFDEVNGIRNLLLANVNLIHLNYRGYYKTAPILNIDWNRYYDLYPDKYFDIPPRMADLIDKANASNVNTLEIGANRQSEAKYAYDPYVKVEGATNLAWNDVLSKNFDFVYAKNTINYLSIDEISKILSRTKYFVANTFIMDKFAENEASVLDRKSSTIRHTLRLSNDSIMRNKFYVYSKETLQKLGLKVIICKRNSALVIKTQ